MNKLLLKHIIGITILLFIAFLSDYVCPIRTFTGIRCIGCGITTAYLCVLNLNFVGAFHQHPLYLIIPFYALWLIHLDTPLLKHLSRKIKLSVSIIIGSIIVLQYIFSFV